MVHIGSDRGFATDLIRVCVTISGCALVASAIQVYQGQRHAAGATDFLAFRAGGRTVAGAARGAGRTFLAAGIAVLAIGLGVDAIDSGRCKI